jgi:hypothetical protein
MKTTISPQTNAAKLLVNQLDDATIIPDIHASYTHVIDEKFWWIYQITFCTTLFCRCSRREVVAEFGMN